MSEKLGYRADTFFLATMCLANRRELGNAKTVDMQHLWIQEARKSGRFVTKVGTSVNPANLLTKPLARPKIEQLMHTMDTALMGVSWS